MSRFRRHLGCLAQRGLPGLWMAGLYLEVPIIARALRGLTWTWPGAWLRKHLRARLRKEQAAGHGARKDLLLLARILLLGTTSAAGLLAEGFGLLKMMMMMCGCCCYCWVQLVASRLHPVVAKSDLRQHEVQMPLRTALVLDVVVGLQWEHVLGFVCHHGFVDQVLHVLQRRDNARHGDKGRRCGGRSQDLHHVRRLVSSSFTPRVPVVVQGRGAIGAPDLRPTGLTHGYVWLEGVLPPFCLLDLPVCLASLALLVFPEEAHVSWLARRSIAPSVRVHRTLIELTQLAFFAGRCGQRVPRRHACTVA
mmetsp:Transcript_43629/g.78800  ORF Transcript_43629/g.78800 Transcript_43629/m.78800 type:complete len:307 (-) Transcript_43629:443-1363(-)